MSTSLFMRTIGMVGIVMILSMAVTFAFGNNNSSALSGSEFKAGRIIDDAYFYNGTTMSAAEIQNFLNAKVPTCDTNGSQGPYYDKYGNRWDTRADYGRANGSPPPYTCLKSYMQDTGYKAGQSGLCSAIEAKSGRTAAQIIDDVARACHISQKAILVMLQKEQGLVTDDWPWPIQYRSAMGYGCPDTAACDSEYYGFFNQVYNAALQFQRYKADPNNWNHVPFMTNQVLYQANAPECGSRSTYIENYATAGLYNYTPYTPNAAALSNLYGTGDGCSAYGNRNFWRYYNDWFGPTIGTKIIKKDGAVSFYLYTNGTKILIPDYDTYLRYGFDKVSTTSVSAAFLDGLPDGGSLGKVMRTSNGALFLMVNGKRHAISSYDQCTNWGINCSDPYTVKTVDQEAANIPGDGGPLQPLMRNNGIIYKMNAGKKEPFLDAKSILQNGYGFEVTEVDSLLAQQPLGEPLPSEGSAIKSNSNQSIYVYLNKSYHLVPDLEVFYAWRLDKYYFSKLPASSFDTTPPSSASTLSRYFAHNSVKILIDNGRQFRIDATTNPSWPTATDSPYVSPILNRLPIFNINTNTVLQTEKGSVLKVANQVIRRIPTVKDYYYLGGISTNTYKISESSLSGLGSGPLLLSQGRLFKRPNDSTIYSVQTDNSSHNITGEPLFNALYVDPSDVLNIDTTTASHYVSAAGHKSYVNKNGARYIYSPTKGMYVVDSKTLSEWGSLAFSTSVAPYNGNVTKKVMTRFAQKSDGSIYYGKDGAAHHITNYETLYKLGGHPDNIMVVFDDFIDDLPTGAPIN